jgi:hypothetical protein
VAANSWFFIPLGIVSFAASKTAWVWTAVLTSSPNIGAIYRTLRSASSVFISPSAVRAVRARSPLTLEARRTFRARDRPRKVARRSLPICSPDPIRGVGDHIPEIIAINEIKAAAGGIDEQSAPEIFWLELFFDGGADADSPCLPVLIDVDSPWLIQPPAKLNHAGLVRLLHFELTEVGALRSDGPIPLGIGRGALYP